ncbi:MAG: hypothetical protein IJN64_11485 [Lachnospiraceae bacterium]|nr:hypothetical protein [Lachnospiraceae bacterium]
MEKNILETLEPLTEDDVKVQYCDRKDCLHDCPPIGGGANCGPIITLSF